MLDRDASRADLCIRSATTIDCQRDRVGSRFCVDMSRVFFTRPGAITEVPRQAADFTCRSTREGHGQIVDTARRGGCEPCHGSRVLDCDTCRADFRVVATRATRGQGHGVGARFSVRVCRV